MPNSEQHVKEEWRDIKDYEGLYQVSNFGNVRRLYVSGKIKILKPKKDNYLRVDLSKNNKHRLFSVSRLVAIAFIPNPENLPQVNHKDENKLNNCVENLEWCTAIYNHNYGTINQRISEHVSIAKKGKPNPNKGKHFSEEARQHMSEAQKGKVVSEEARRHMSEAKKGKKLSEEAKQKLREVNTGSHRSEETRKKISEAHKGKKYSDEYKKNMSEKIRMWWQNRKMNVTED